MRYLQVIKTVLYMLAGVAVLTFNREIMDYVGTVVGAVIFAYGVDRIIISIIKKEVLSEEGLFSALTHVLLAVVMFVVTDDIVKMCIVWAVWSILREGKELSESVHRLSRGNLGLVNAIESVVIIVFSFMMITEPTEHHAHVHVIILGIELMLEVLFPIVNEVFDKSMEKRRAKALSVQVSGSDISDNSVAEELPIADLEEELSATEDGLISPENETK
ncbi:MAG: hypothetical protein J5762_03745 [Clostridia bacterium]|nr:hypothetical protein [Clostridia bacterium]